MTYCFDLDGTLCHTIGSDYENSVPYPERIAHVNRLCDEGHTIIIDSARGRVSGKNWTDFTAAQLKDWNVQFHTCRVGVKFAADEFIDDKAGTSAFDFFGGSPE